MVRDLLIDHVADVPARSEIRPAPCLEFFSAAKAAHQRRPARRLLKSDVDMVHLYGKNVANWLHDILEPDNHPVWFAEFVARAEAVGLQYLSERRPPRCSSRVFLVQRSSRHVRQLADDDVSIEQHLDVLRNRPFRADIVMSSGHPACTVISRLRGWKGCILQAN